MKPKVLSVFGTRPEAIKMAPLSIELNRENGIQHTICVTGQHREMLDQVMAVFDLKPDIDLNVMKPGQTLNEITSAVLNGMQTTLEEIKPNLVLVHGDTTTSFATALAAFYAGIDVAHIEAGLRTYDLSQPFPEELNRQMTSKIASLHFAPTAPAAQNLIAEGIPRNKIWVTGNTVVDALKLTLEKIKTNAAFRADTGKALGLVLPFNWEARDYVLITGHRRENFGASFESICIALKELAGRFPDIEFVYPVHLNPSVQGPVNRILANIPNFHLLPPLPYHVFSLLLSNCHLVMTDSGGIQEEAPSFGKPVLVFRDKTERPEAVDSGAAILVGSNTHEIVERASSILSGGDEYFAMAMKRDVFGNGSASHQIKDVLFAELLDK